MNYKRSILPTILSRLWKGRAIVLYGARQVGKTTLVRTIEGLYPDKSLFLNCDEPDIRALLTNATSTSLQTLVGTKKLILIDEAQRVENIGLTLKLMVDNLPDIQVIATGSSAFELSNDINEPLTGRKYEFKLYPLTISEITDDPLTATRLLESQMLYGFYPEVVNNTDTAPELLHELATSYLYKDILKLGLIKNTEALEKLLQALALQIGSEVSYNELSSIAQIDKKTVAHYLRILEQAFIITVLKPFSRNLRNELKKMRKVYFLDLGIRNALINNFNPLSLRQDVGALWENYLIIERLKQNHYQGLRANSYFWRTHAQQEIDYLEEQGGTLCAYEFKWRPKAHKTIDAFAKAYPDSTQTTVHQKNYLEHFIAT